MMKTKAIQNDSSDWEIQYFISKYYQIADSFMKQPYPFLRCDINSKKMSNGLQIINCWNTNLIK